MVVLRSRCPTAAVELADNDIRRNKNRLQRRLFIYLSRRVKALDAPKYQQQKNRGEREILLHPALIFLQA